MNIFRFYISNIALKNMNYNFYKKFIYKNTTLRFKNALSSSIN